MTLEFPVDSGVILCAINDCRVITRPVSSEHDILGFMIKFTVGLGFLEIL